MALMREYVLGGQAVIEGVMMKGKSSYSVAVRSPSGEIVTDRFPIKTNGLVERMKNALFLRGLIILFSMMVIGIRAINFSASIAVEEETPMSPLWLGLTIVLAFLLALSLFFILPFAAGLAISGFMGIKVGGLWFNIYEGVVRVALFFLYIWSISRIEDINRVFQYHGAEHKVVNAYESKDISSLEAVSSYSRFHPRCGTSFIIFVLIVSILVFSLIPSGTSVLGKALLRLLLLPLVGGISYELIRISSRNRDSLLFRILSLPGLFSQRFTTKEPDISQLEVAMASLRSLEEPLL